MKTSEASAIGKQISILLEAKRVENAYEILAPALAQKISFATLDRIGKEIGVKSSPAINNFLEHVAQKKTMGGWVIIGSTLKEQLKIDLPDTLKRCRAFINRADVWYEVDILGERVPGYALMMDFKIALAELSSWRDDPNHWVRRDVGVGVHVWTKRSKGEKRFEPQAKALLKFLQPMFEEQHIEAVKGVGWGLKTLGKFYPEVTTEWLTRQVKSKKKYRALMLKKAMTYL
ncbi:MAG: DNA alkylation repair protein [Chloroflexi bacterium]|nr:DNA alkylation repair protein [Chloroflexota bacterium]